MIEQGNDSLIAIKANQPKLLRTLQHQFQTTAPLSIASDTEYTRGRCIRRSISVLAPSTEIDPNWICVQRVIRVERTGTRAGKPFSEPVFYISSRSDEAAEFARRIRGHWQIENRWHWVKDVILHEDKTPLWDGPALTNIAILRTMVVNLFRQQGFDSITKAIRYVAHDVDRLFSFFQ